MLVGVVLWWRVIYFGWYTVLGRAYYSDRGCSTLVMGCSPSVYYTFTVH